MLLGLAQYGAAVGTLTIRMSGVALADSGWIDVVSDPSAAAGLHALDIRLNQWCDKLCLPAANRQILVRDGTQWRLAWNIDQIMFSRQAFHGELRLNLAGHFNPDPRAYNNFTIQKDNALTIEMGEINNAYLQFTPAKPLVQDAAVTAAVAKTLLFMNMNPVGIVTFAFRQQLERYWRYLYNALQNNNLGSWNGMASENSREQAFLMNRNYWQVLKDVLKGHEPIAANLNSPTVQSYIEQLQSDCTSVNERQKVMDVFNNVLQDIRKRPNAPWFLFLLIDLIKEEFNDEFDRLWEDYVQFTEDIFLWLRSLIIPAAVTLQEQLHLQRRYKDLAGFMHDLDVFKGQEMRLPDRFRSNLTHSATLKTIAQKGCTLYNNFSLPGWGKQWFLFYAINFKIYGNGECILPFDGDPQMARDFSYTPPYSSSELTNATYTHTEWSHVNPGVPGGGFHDYLLGIEASMDIFHVGVRDKDVLHGACDGSSQNPYENLLIHRHPSEEIFLCPGNEERVWGYFVAAPQ
ncbi:MAG: hypothetical protein LBJ36_03235 [Synergistaceae bacterium]|nr:hypothetical protein [Synergistaceae bacterium]